MVPKLTEANKAKKNDSKFSTMTMPKTMPVQNLLRYISFKSTYVNKVRKSMTLVVEYHFYLKVTRTLEILIF